MSALEKVLFIKEGMFFPPQVPLGGIHCSDKLRKISNFLLTNFNYVQVVIECKENTRFYLEMFYAFFF